jgi:vacuolar iron transporter family protein
LGVSRKRAAERGGAAWLDRRAVQMDVPPKGSDVRRWRRRLADERQEATAYREMAARRSGEEREIFLALADAEARHVTHWESLLGDTTERTRRPSVRRVFLALLARRFSSIWVLALAQRAETRTPYLSDQAATSRMAADELIHAEVVRALASRQRTRLSGRFRAAVFGANDGLVSNFGLVAGVSGGGVASGSVLLIGLAGLVAGALSMAAGEYVSVRSQRDFVDATSDFDVASVYASLDVDENELALVYRARGIPPDEARRLAYLRLGATPSDGDEEDDADPPSHEVLGGAWGAAVSSFVAFAIGALVPVVPFLFGFSGTIALVVAGLLAGMALLAMGAIVGLLSGAPLLVRAIRQLMVGVTVAAVTYAIGALFGAALA